MNNPKAQTSFNMPYSRDDLYQDYKLEGHCDTHNHCTPFSPDASQKLDEEIRWMQRMGFKRHVLSDHYDKGHLDQHGKIRLLRNRQAYPNLEDEPACPGEWIFDIPTYFETMQAKQSALAAEEDPFDLLIGIELGYLPELAEDYNAMVARWPFDLIIGSAHSYDGQEIYAAREFYDMGKDSAYTKYLERLTQIAEELDCDVIGHYDYVTRYNDYRQPKYLYREYPEHFDRFFRSLIENGVSLEINTGTQVRALASPAPTRSYNLTELDLPDPEILLRYRELGGELISIGSDGHHLGHSGRLFKENLAYLDSLGFKYVFYFKRRKAVAVAIRDEV